MSRARRNEIRHVYGNLTVYAAMLTLVAVAIASNVLGVAALAYFLTNSTPATALAAIITAWTTTTCMKGILHVDLPHRT